MLTHSPSLLHRLDARDRALFTRWVLTPASARARRLAWTVITHLGGVRVSVLAATLPIWASGAMHDGAALALPVLVISHLAVQAVKRTVGRPRPSLGTDCAALVVEPDRFSFPSGHAAAAMSVAFGYAVAFPTLAPLLLVAACAVGLSRVCLGVHYPGDVAAGQFLALITGALALAFR